MLSIFLAASLAFTSEDASLAYTTAEKLVAEHTPRDAGTRRGNIAANYLLDAASATGADVRRDVFVARTPKGDRTFVNLYAELKADDDAPWTVVVSHFDTKSGVNCPGANDGASTSGLLVALSDALFRCREGRGNVMLMWLDGEECMEAYGEDDGLWGSRRAAKVLAERGCKVAGVVCLDMLGDRDLTVFVAKNGTQSLVEKALAAAKTAGTSGKVSSSAVLVKDDHVPFLDAGFPAIDLIDFEFGSAPGMNDYWHSDQDTMDKVSKESLETVGRLVVELVKMLAQG